MNKDYKIKCKNLNDAKEQIQNFLKNASNEELIEYFNNTDIRSIGSNFNSEFKEIKRAANPEYGFASKLLNKDMEKIRKEDFIIIKILFEDCKEIKKDVDFIPFDKMFFECGIRFRNNDGELKNIDSFVVFRDNIKNKIRIYCTYKDARDCTFLNGFMRLIEIGESDMNNKKWEIENPEESKDCDKYRDGTEDKMRDCILKVIRYISYKISTKEFRNYKVCKNGQLIDKELVYSSEVKAHKRHFWEDSGRFIIPTLSKEEILKRGYGIDDLVYKDNQIRRNVPYTIIGNSIRNKELEKQNRKIDLIKKRIWKCEEKIYDILREIYPDKLIRRHDRRTLKGLELDFNIPELRLGIEYDGEQHFDEDLYKKLYGDGFHAQVKRDRMKNVACRRKKIKLVRIKYDEKLNITNIKKLINKQK